MIKRKQILIELEYEQYSDYKKIIQTDGYGFEINDFCNPKILCDKKLYENRVRDYKKIVEQYQDRIFTLHGAFYGLVIHSKDRDIAEISKNKIIRSIQTAVELNCSKVVFHSGIIPQSIGNMTEMITEIHYNFWSELLQKYTDIEICIENVWEAGPEFFESLLHKVNHKRFTLCIDNGHADVFSNYSVSEWKNCLLKYISHIHLSDNDKKADLHLAFGDGQLNIEEEIRQLAESNNELTWKLEVHTFDETLRSIRFLNEHRLLEL